MAGDPSPQSPPAPTNQSQRDPVSRLVATIAILLAIGAILGFLYVGHVTTTPGPAGSVGPQGPQGPAGTPGVSCSGAACPVNRTYATFAPTFVLPVNANTTGSTLDLSFCENSSFGSWGCFLNFTNGANRTVALVGLNYTITPAFEYVGADPTLGIIHVKPGQTTEFVLWFQMIQPKGTVESIITIAITASKA